MFFFVRLPIRISTLLPNLFIAALLTLFIVPSQAEAHIPHHTNNNDDAAITHFSQCKNGNWKTVFRNQGYCLLSVAKQNHQVSGNVKYFVSNVARQVSFSANVAMNTGMLSYRDANHDWYIAKIKSVAVSDHDAYFAGYITQSNHTGWKDEWFYVKVTDATPDQIAGSFTDKDSALQHVADLQAPEEGPYEVIRGTITIR